MPFVVQQLIEGRGAPVCAQPDEPVRNALDRMIENEFGSLPVTDAEGRPIGIVTSESILNALNNFGVTTAELRVMDAMIKPAKVAANEDLFDTLEMFSDNYAVLIHDGDGRLTGIITDFDAMEYFRRRAEDMMMVEDIESALKDHIRAAFTDDHGELDSGALAAAIAEITDANRDLGKRFKRALGQYLSAQGNGDKLDSALAEDTFAKVFADQGPTKQLDDLTMYEFVQLLLHKSKESKVNSVFGLAPGAIRTLLDGVRETRNVLAHFRGQVSLRERSRLRYAATWLSRHQPAVPAPSISEVLTIVQPQLDPVAPIEPEAIPITDPVVPPVEVPGVEESSTVRESRFAPLALRLSSEPVEQARLPLSFGEIERIIDDKLPPSARRHRSWWSNSTAEHPQAEQWLAAGWRVSSINMDDERVVFVRIKEQDKAYIVFFGALLDELRQATQLPLKPSTQGGQSWMMIGGFAEDGPQRFLVYSFTRDRQFRVELYIDKHDPETHKRIYDNLYAHKDEIETAIGAQLRWEPLDNWRTIRISLAHEGSISGTDDELAALRQWAAAATLRFQQVLGSRIDAVLGAGAAAEQPAAREDE